MTVWKRFIFTIGTMCWLAGSGTTLLNGEAAGEDQLVGWWRFDDIQEQQVPDRSGRGNQGHVAYGEWVKGIDGKAIRFGHSSASFKVPSSPSLSPVENLTLEAWVQLKEVPSGFPSVIRKEGSYALRFCDRNIGIVLWRKGQPVVLEGPDIGGDTERWRHLACTYDGTKMTLYVDGRVVAAKEQQGFLDSTYAELHMGGYAGHYLLDGVLDEAKVYARTLRPEEIARSFEKGRSALRAQKDVEIESHR